MLFCRRWAETLRQPARHKFASGNENKTKTFTIDARSIITALHVLLGDFVAWLFFVLVLAVSLTAAIYSVVIDPVTGATSGDEVVQVLTNTVVSAALPLTIGLVGLKYLRGPARIAVCALMLPLLYAIAVKPAFDRTATDFKPNRRSPLQNILALPQDTFDLATLTVAHQRGFSFEHEDCPYRIALPSGSAHKTENGYRIGFATG